MHCFNYSIERTNNRTSSASFKDDGVLIRLAGRLSEAEEQRHVTSLLRRMVRRLPLTPARGGTFFHRACRRHTLDIFRDERGEDVCHEDGKWLEYRACTDDRGENIPCVSLAPSQYVGT